MPISPHAIEAEALVKRYRTGHRTPPVEALRGLSFAVATGSVFGLLGPNGAGKSTTTKILTTLALPTSGAARVAGADVVREAAAVRTRIGYVSQGTSTDPLLTVRENLALAARLRGVGRADAISRALRLIEEFALTEHRERLAGKLSGGTRRRLDVAAALVHAPRVLFLDEPTTGLDPESRAAMWGEIRRLAGQESLTVVLTTHYLEEADRLADRVMIVDHGAMVVEGTPQALKADLAGDGVRVELFEPDADRVRRAAASLPLLRDVVVEVSGPTGSLIARAADGSAALGPLLQALDAAGIAFGAASVSGPTLDDVYLHHVGHSFGEVRPSEGAAA
ncbi:ABC transporter ATP-binding protein [Homoserinibacter sp. GY 40078]|uniref:ABC transporter ATP-binding protein n=1 Tax=Homoserinibacter sp. GY 40078 TaxID=2603275 RepID=UPI0011CA1D72|nr:ABC transporter ATP-binding protein [Homoserinibacter sp. GY 40078]TXK17160.1 ABC transporter ATP-binding protein [Homoserinibacter sp. GY 40078]